MEGHLGPSAGPFSCGLLPPVVDEPAFLILALRTCRICKCLAHSFFISPPQHRSKYVHLPSNLYLSPWFHYLWPDFVWFPHIYKIRARFSSKSPHNTDPPTTTSCATGLDTT